jgi:hypothetical protein
MERSLVVNAIAAAIKSRRLTDEALPECFAQTEQAAKGEVAT